jgi:hypothetical protein
LYQFLFYNCAVRQEVLLSVQEDKAMGDKNKGPKAGLPKAFRVTGKIAGFTALGLVGAAAVLVIAGVVAAAVSQGDYGSMSAD